MSRTPADDVAPTMIIPRGTQIEMDAEGHLSIRSPGNLVVQNSGKYGTLESLGGSIRIDRGVEVEATTVRCAETCYVQGFLTAWKVMARSLQFVVHARAHVVLQETERLEIGRDARLVGNFSSEKELFGLFSRFAQQVRSLPFFFERRHAPASLPEREPGHIDVLGAAVVPEAAPAASQEPASPPGPAPLSEFPEPLLFARILLERESERRLHTAASQRALDELIKLLQEQDLETLAFTWRTLFGRIAEPREDARRAQELVRQYYTAADPA
jgi:hypothetical protein